MKNVIFKRLGGYAVTTEANYHARIMDANKVMDASAFDDPEQIIDYYVEWFGSRKSDFIVIE